MAQQGSRLLALPPELRNEIWDLCLRRNEDWFGTMNIEISHRQHRGFTVPQLALLQTCQQVRSELGGVLFGRPDFMRANVGGVDAIERASRWLETHAVHAIHIRHIRLMADFDSELDMRRERDCVLIDVRVRSRGEIEVTSLDVERMRPPWSNYAQAIKTLSALQQRCARLCDGMTEDGLDADAWEQVLRTLHMLAPFEEH